jgi:OmpA-OmpF porin, OOP family
MAINLIENISSYITPDIINKASAFLHESPSSTSMAMSGIVPTLLGSVTNMASSPGGATQLAGLLGNSGQHEGLLNGLPGFFSGGSSTTGLIHQGEGILSTLFGNRLGSVTSSISNFSGVGSGSATSLMAMAAPIVMGAIARLRSSQNLNPTQLAGLLSSQKSAVTAAMPAGLRNSIDESNIQGLRSVTVQPMVVPQPAKTRWWPLLLLLAGILGLLAFLFGRGKPNVAATRPAVPVPAMQEVKLCNSNTLSLRPGSFNYNLASFLSSGNNVDLPRTFVFDNLNFDSATTNLTAPSRSTVDNLVTIMKACPDAEVQLAGHTDNTGDPAANKTLSTNRAVAIKDMLVAGGVAPDRISTIGYGEDKPIASNDTPDGKARNRRTELVVLKR